MPTPADWAAGVQHSKDAAAAASGIDPITAKVMANYGYLAGYLNEPEIGPLLREAAQKGWSKDILQGRVYQTQWWHVHAAGQRDLATLQSTDPAEYQQKLDAKVTELQIMAQAGGAYFSDPQQLKDLALSILGDPSLSQSTVQYMVFAHAAYTGQQVGGTLGNTMAGVKALASQYYVPISDEAAFNWSKRIAQGASTQDGLEAYMRNQALSKYSQFTDEINAGSTLKDLFDPYVQQTAKLLDVSPDMVRLDDPKWAQMIDTKDPSTGKPRAMTLSEASEFVKRSDDYDKTQPALDAAAKFGETLGETFGVVKA